MSDSVQALIQGVSSPTRETRLHCVDRLVQMGSPAVAPLCDTLRFGGLLARCAAADALGRLRSRAATPLLVAALRDKESAVRERAAAALGGIGDPEAVPALCAAATRNWDAFVVPRAVEALGRIGDPRAMSTLTKLLSFQSGDFTVQIAAAEALGKTGHPGAVSPLIRALDTQSTGLFVEACHALGRLKSVEAVPALCRVAANANWHGPVAADALTQALVQIGEESLPLVAGELDDARAAPVMLGALKGLGARAFPALQTVLDRGSTAAKLRALELLGRVGREDVGVWEIAAKGLDDRDEKVRIAALLVLAQSDSHVLAARGRPLLEDRSPRVRLAAAVMVCRLEPRPDLLSVVTEALEDPDPGLVTNAASALRLAAPHSPAAELRAAATVLRRRCGLLRRAAPEIRSACREALTAIEGRIAPVRSLPVPAQQAFDAAQLPVPGCAPAERPDGLPIPDRGAD